MPDDYQFRFAVPFEEIEVDVEGARLNALYFQQPNSRGLVFFLHGNGGNLDPWTSNIEYYRQVNYDLFIFDYRGYGKSSGHNTSEKQLHADVRAAWDAVAPRYQDKPIVVYGRSLGAALAAKLAKDVNPDLLILVSPFTSMVAMAHQQYPYLPDWLVRYPLRTDERIADIQSPIVFVHGDKDYLIPLEHSRTLHGLARPGAKLLEIRGAGHNDIHQFESYIDGLTAELPNQAPGNRHLTTDDDQTGITSPIHHCFRNEYSNGGNSDVEELTVIVDGDDASGTYNWIPAYKDTRLGRFNGTFRSGNVNADYEYEQEGQLGSTSISIVVSDKQAIVSGGPTELGLGQTLARVEC